MTDTLVAEARYAPYLRRQQADAAYLRAAVSRQLELPLDLDFGALGGLRTEEVLKLSVRRREGGLRRVGGGVGRSVGSDPSPPHQQVRPTTVFAASRISGVTPETLLTLARVARRRQAQPGEDGVRLAAGST